MTLSEKSRTTNSNAFEKGTRDVWNWVYEPSLFTNFNEIRLLFILFAPNVRVLRSLFRIHSFASLPREKSAQLEKCRRCVCDACHPKNSNGDYRVRFQENRGVYQDAVPYRNSQDTYTREPARARNGLNLSSSFDHVCLSHAYRSDGTFVHSSTLVHTHTHLH